MAPTPVLDTLTDVYKPLQQPNCVLTRACPLHIPWILSPSPKKPNLLTPNVKTTHISPYLGREVTGVQLSELTDAGRDELALFVAERKVVIFPGPELQGHWPRPANRICQIFRHPAPPHVGQREGYPEFHIVYRDAQHDRFQE